ncbi:MAG: arginine--tRNA ligase [Desulfobulbaceae bacterium]|jgi:arginyl-tRNA synthetase|nr:arginine--tRNA ligase [Desulfobulbaceae bacterium]
MIKSQLQEWVDVCFGKGVEQGFWSNASAGCYALEEPRHEGQGDYACNAAMVIAGKEKKATGKKVNPRQVAEQFVTLLQENSDLVEKVEIAGPGFINFFLQPVVWSQVLSVTMAEDGSFGFATVKNGKRVLVEFVSANPTGPLSIGHGRQAVLGDAIARLLESVGYDVEREYYYNDAGRQMRVLGASTRARYLELLGLDGEFPEDGYQGDYISDIAQSIIDEKGDGMKDEEDVMFFKEVAEKAIFNDIAQTLQRMSIRFDHYFNEHTLYDEGHIDDVVSILREKGLVYEQDDATWFKTSAFGQEQDRVIIKSTGEPTYRLPDICYHREKFKRGYDWMVDVFGADHIATVPDVLAGVEALGYNPEMVTVVLHQFVTLLRDGKQVKMSTRKATFITVDELIDEVGVDAVRFFFLMRKADSQLEFDLDVAKEEGKENPVFYVQYGHARICTIFAKAAEKGVEPLTFADADFSLLTLPEELKIMKTIGAFPAMVQAAADDLAPHRIVFYLRELAGQFHSFYSEFRVLDPGDLERSRARLWLMICLSKVLRNGLTLIGVSAPVSM